VACRRGRRNVFGYILRRLGQSLIVLIIVSLIVFVLIHLLPGTPCRAELGPKANPASLAACNKVNGFNRPIPVQYGIYIWHLLHGNLGYSYTQDATVAQLFLARFPKSMLLVGLSLVVAIVVAIPLGIYQAVKRNSIGDYTATGISFVLYSFPTFWLGFILIAAFAVSLHLLPPTAPQGNSVGAILAEWKGLVLPVLTLAGVTVALFSRFMRSATIESLTQDYIRTARAKGLKERTILLVHALRNSMIPMATLIGLSLPGILGGAVVVEELFNYPGVGLLFLQSLDDRDYSVLLGLVMVAAVGVVVGNLLADILYAILDPRIRY
jgi:peptide/nickel transport system permease protein